MKPSATTTSTTRRLQPLLAAARDRALQLGHGVLASLTLPLATSFKAPAFASGLEIFLWEQPDRDFALHGQGEAVRLVSTGEQRFRDIDERLSRLIDEAVVEQESGVDLAQPVSLGGFAFTARGEAEAPEWRDFPDALTVVPRFLIARVGDAASLTVNVFVDAQTDIDAALETLEAELATTLSASSHAPAFRPESSPEIVDGQRELWLEDVRELTAVIDTGEAEKVVLARRLEVDAANGFDIDGAIDRLRGRYPGCTAFAIGHNNACFLGATPEMLVRLDDGIVRADCLAGSAPRGRTADQDDAFGRALLDDDKERREHAMVVRGLTEALDGICSQVDVPITPSLRKMANVQHLFTPVSAQTEGRRHVLELAERLHPTPAVGGLPLRRALCLIDRQERFSRGWYAGPIGWMDARGNGEFVVALRSALVTDSRAFLYAGCGIVAGSDPAREYEESQLKLQAMLWALNGSS